MFDASDFQKVSREFTMKATHLGPVVQLVVRKTAKDIQGTARTLAPVDTGALRSSIKTSDLRGVGQSGVMEAEIGPTVDYGAYVELGTSRQRPQPYMRPALEKHTDAFVSALEKVVRDAIG